MPPSGAEGTQGSGGDEEKLEAGRRSPGSWDSDLRGQCQLARAGVSEGT